MEPTSSQPTYRTRLEEILESEGRKQIWLAEQIGVSRALMSMIVGGYYVDDATAKAIADALGRDPEDVFPRRAWAS